MRKTTKVEKRNIFIVATIIYLVPAFLFPKHGEGMWEHVYYFGYPNTFFIFYSREYYMQFRRYALGEPIPFTAHFSIDILQFAVNILSTWLITLVLYKLADRFLKPLFKRCFHKIRNLAEP